MVLVTADCFPVALAAPTGDPRLGVLHVGWRGLLAGIVASGVAALGEAHARGGGRAGDRSLLLRGGRGGGRALPRALRRRRRRGPDTSTCALAAERALREAGVELRRADRASAPLASPSSSSRTAATTGARAGRASLPTSPEQLRERTTSGSAPRSGPASPWSSATKYVVPEEMALLAEAGVEVVGENRLQDLAAKHERCGDRFQLALHRPPPVPQGERRLRPLRARPFARLALGREAPERAGARRGQPRRRGDEVGSLAGRCSRTSSRRCGSSASRCAA